MFYAEVQAPYAGDTTGSRIRTVGGFSSASVAGQHGYVPEFVTQEGVPVAQDTGWIQLIRPGDIIKLNHFSPSYRLSSGEPFDDANGDGVKNGTEAYVDMDGDSSYDAPNLSNGYINALPWTLTAIEGKFVPTTGANASGLRIDANGDGNYDAPMDRWAAVSFSILRQPRKTAAPAVQLPAGMVLDLGNSGTVGLDPLTGVAGPYIVLYGASGGIVATSSSAGSSGLLGPLYLLIGKRVKLGGDPEYPTTTNVQYNYQDLTNIWVTIQPQTGLVASTEVGGDADANGTISVAESRAYAARALAMGGR